MLIGMTRGDVDALPKLPSLELTQYGEQFLDLLESVEISLGEDVFLGVYEAFLTPRCLIPVAETRSFEG